MVFYLLVFSKNGKIFHTFTYIGLEISNLYNIPSSWSETYFFTLLQVTSISKKLRKNNIVLGAISVTFFVFLSTVFLGMPQQEAINLTYFLLVAVKEKKHSIMFIPYNNGNTKMEFPNVNPHDVSGNIGAG